MWRPVVSDGIHKFKSMNQTFSVTALFLSLFFNDGTIWHSCKSWWTRLSHCRTVPPSRRCQAATCQADTALMLRWQNGRIPRSRLHWHDWSTNGFELHHPPTWGGVGQRDQRSQQLRCQGERRTMRDENIQCTAELMCWSHTVEVRSSQPAGAVDRRCGHRHDRRKKVSWDDSWKFEEMNVPCVPECTRGMICWPGMTDHRQ